MARKLTEQERNNIDILVEMLHDALPANQRYLCAGIASALVREPGDTISHEGVERILSKYGDEAVELASAVEAAVLDPVEGVAGSFTLKVSAQPLAEGEPEAARGTADANGGDALAGPEGSKTPTKDDHIDSDGSANHRDSGDEPSERSESSLRVPSAPEDEGRFNISEEDDPNKREGNQPSASDESTSDASDEGGRSEKESRAEKDEASQTVQEEPSQKRGRRAARPRRHRSVAAKVVSADATREDSAVDSGASLQTTHAEGSEPIQADSGNLAESNGSLQSAPLDAETLNSDTSVREATYEEKDQDASAASATPARRRRSRRASRGSNGKNAQDLTSSDAANDNSGNNANGEARDSVKADNTNDAASGGRKGTAQNEGQAGFDNTGADKGNGGNASGDQPSEGSGSNGEAHAGGKSKDGAAKPNEGGKGKSSSGKSAERGKGKGNAGKANDGGKPATKGNDKTGGEGKAAAKGKPEAKGNAGYGDAKPSHDPSRNLKKVPYIRRGGDEEATIRQKIVSLDQRFWMNGWLLSHPGAYTLYERELKAMSDVLKDGALPGDITRRQLAYQIGGDEKFFEYGSDGFKLLRAMGAEDLVRHQPMPSPDLLYHAPRRRKHMRVLVTENLDPWLDVRNLMYEDGRTTILGERIHAVVMGGGMPVLEHNRLSVLLDSLGADTTTVLYWGDIDRAGLDIMLRLKELLGDAYKFRAFMPAYQLMVQKAMERYPDPLDNESTGQMNIEAPDISIISKGLTEEQIVYVQAVIDNCELIPQEILTRRDL